MVFVQKKCKFQRPFCENHGRRGTFGDRACLFFVSCFEGGSQAENTAYADVFVVSRCKNVVFRKTPMFAFFWCYFACMRNFNAKRCCLLSNIVKIWANGNRAYTFPECFAVHGSSWPYAKHQETGGWGGAAGFRDFGEELRDLCWSAPWGV